MGQLIMLGTLFGLIVLIFGWSSTSTPKRAALARDESADQ